MFPDFFNASTGPSPSSTAPVSYSGDSRLFVVSIGGSLLYRDGIPDSDAIKGIASAIESLHSSGYKFAIVVGGGVLARNFIETGKQLNANNFELDSMGIAVTRLNAMLLINAIGPCHNEVLTDIKKAKPIVEAGKIPVFGGLIPGVTTDFDAALLAEYLGGTFVNLSNVAGIFSSNPKENPDAELYREISYNALLKILLAQESKPGQNIVFDIPAALVLKRSKITAFFLDGNNLQNFESAVRGESFDGTIVSEQGESEDAIFAAEEETEEKPKKRKKKKTAIRPKVKKNRKDYDSDPDVIAMGLKLG